MLATPWKNTALSEDISWVLFYVLPQQLALSGICAESRWSCWRLCSLKIYNWFRWSLMWSQVYRVYTDIMYLILLQTTPYPISMGGWTCDLFWPMQDGIANCSQIQMAWHGCQYFTPWPFILGEFFIFMYWTVNVDWRDFVQELPD